MKTIAMRTDASPEIGVGHFMRCINLARMLEAGGFPVRMLFICNENLPTDLTNLLLNYKFEWRAIFKGNHKGIEMNSDVEQTIEILKQEGVQWIIVDHYQIDVKWEQRVRPFLEKIIVIDDLANRFHDCDILLDQNLYPNFNSRYDALVPLHCQKLLGPTFLLLKPEYYAQIKQPRTRVRKVMVNFGGSDPTREIEKVLSAIESLGSRGDKLKFYIIAGPANKYKENIKSVCNGLPNVEYFEKVEMDQLLQQVDLAIGAGGITLWERCCMGVPSGVIAIADNQIAAVKEAERLGLIWNLGKSADVTSNDIEEFLIDKIRNPEIIAERSRVCLEFMDPLIQKGEHPLLSILKEEF